MGEVVTVAKLYLSPVPDLGIFQNCNKLLKPTQSPLMVLNPPISFMTITVHYAFSSQ